MYVTLKTLLLKIAQDWKQFNDKDELKIMHKYTEYGRQSITLYSGYMITTVIVFLSFPMASPVLDLIMPLKNGTRPKNLPYYAEYGIDLEEYYYPLMAQSLVGGVGTIVVLVSFDLEFILIVQHVIGLFSLVNFRLKKVEKMSEEIENGKVIFVKGDYLAYLYTISAIDLHKKVVEYIEIIEDSYNLAWLIIMSLNMFSLIKIKLNDPNDLFRYLFGMFSISIHFYYIFLPGQKIINSSEEVFHSCYACKWYNLSEKTKNLIKIMLLRSLKPCYLTGGKMFTMSMDTYCSMMKTGLSVFTVLNS
ncbi:odorant receptor 63a-like [Copidosoma floridanum]|uniref:odorant receptor 63a-like n=1 Tax=Copidosoma floridanum TaxID=29053 RepID=UPI000C6FB2E0|nr:odorant receptor 63a-like [Copidosoma floridanum]